MDKMATLLEVKEFFEYKTITELKEDWVKLSEDEKEWFKTEVGKVIHELG